MTDQQQPLINALGARAVVREWAQGAQTLAILEAVHRMGWLTQLTQPTPLPNLTTETWTPTRVLGVLGVLRQTGVVTETTEGWQLTPPFADLTTGASGVNLDSVLASVRLDLSALEELDQNEQWTLGGAAALTVARDAGVASDPVAQMLYRSVYEAIPELAEVLQSEGPMLDLGCGVGGALLTTAQLYPQLRLVGVDIAPEVIAEVELRRDQLGLAGQVELRCVDARTLPDRHVFRVAYWAQSFFPDAVRADTLAVLRQALTEDGLLILQEQPATATDVVQQAQRGITAGRTTDDLAQEAEKAGFTLVSQVTTPLGNLVLLRNS